MFVIKQIKFNLRRTKSNIIDEYIPLGSMRMCMVRSRMRGRRRGVKRITKRRVRRRQLKNNQKLKRRRQNLRTIYPIKISMTRRRMMRMMNE